MAKLDETLKKLKKILARTSEIQSIEIFERIIDEEELSPEIGKVLIRLCRSSYPVPAPAFTGTMAFSPGDLIQTAIEELEKFTEGDES